MRTKYSLEKMVNKCLKYEKIMVALLYAAVICVIYAQVVFGGKTLISSLYYPHGVTEVGAFGYKDRKVVNIFNIDLGSTAYYEFPLNRLVGDVYLQGHLPLWNPYQAAGTPLAAQYASRVFFPYQILEDICPYWAWDYFILGRLWIAGFFTFLFLRSLSLSRRSSFLGGIFYMFSGTMVWFINLEEMANVAMLAPVLLLCLEKLIQTKRNVYIALSAVAFALVLLAGQPEVAFYVMLLVACYFLFRVITEQKQILPILSYSARFIIVILLSLALSSPLLFPFVEYVKNSYNTHPAGGPMGVIGPSPLFTVVSIFVPSFFETPTVERNFPYNGVWDCLGGYSGVLVIYLILLASFIKTAGGGSACFFLRYSAF